MGLHIFQFRMEEDSNGQYFGWEFRDILNNGQLFEITGDT